MTNLKFAPATAALCLLAITALQSCDKIAEQLNYDLPLQTGNIQISIPPSSDLSAAHVLGTGTSYYNIDSFIKAGTKNLLGVKNIRTVTLSSCTVTLNNPTSANNFSNIESAYSSFYSDGNSTPYQLSLNTIPDEYSSLLSIPVDGTAELKTYLSGNHFTYTLGGKLRKAITDTLKCTVQYSYNVNIKG